MLANERVITIAASSPAGETSVTSASAASGLSGRQVTATVGWPAVRIRSATLIASDVEPEREMMTTGSRVADCPVTPPPVPPPPVAAPATSTPSGRRISSDNGAAMIGRRNAVRPAAAATWAR